jgi:NitT/TauT family transport system ATP-binding protein
MADRESTADVFQCRAVGLGLLHHGAHRRIVEDITLDVCRGEFLTIVGASGTGKTTLLRLLGGLAPASDGTIVFRGKPVDGPPDGVVVVFQDYSHALLQWRTVAGNVALGLEGRVAQAERAHRVRTALEMVGLEHCADDHPWQLSGGMQQRVQIARALALHPDVLLMDEPFGALDAMTKAALQDELLRVHARTGTSFVFITHDIEEAVYLGDRVVVLGGPPGRIHRIVPVALPRPRDQIETRQMPEFLRHRLDIHAAVLEAAGEPRDARP